MNTVSKIREVIEQKGGLMSFTASIRKGRLSGRPTRYKLKKELLILSDAELNIAFFLGLIGNNNKVGSILN